MTFSIIFLAVLVVMIIGLTVLKAGKKVVIREPW